MTQRKRQKSNQVKRIPLIATDEESKAIKEKGNGRKTRMCLKCNSDFISTGKSNRICPVCSEINLRVGKREGEAFPGVHHRKKNIEGKV